MKEKITPFDCAERIAKALSQGALLNTSGEKFNSMVIGWGHLGVIWGKRTFVVYVRQGRYTRSQLDATGEFSVSIPLESPSPAINRICGSMSGRNVDKAEAAKLTLEAPSTIHTPGVKEYPLTLECRVLFSQLLPLEGIPEDIRTRAYPQDVGSEAPLANRDAHIAYIGEIVDAYIIR